MLKINLNRRSGNYILISTVFTMIFFSMTTGAQETSHEQERLFIKSMGLPKVWKPYYGPMFSIDYRTFGGKQVGELNFGVYRDLMNPILGLLGMSGEGYTRLDGKKMDYGIRLLASCRVFYLNGGIDYSKIMKKKLLFFFLLFLFIQMILVAAHEFIHSTCGVNKLHLTGVKRV